MAGSSDSRVDRDGVTYASVGLQIGRSGLDLRTPNDPNALSALRNARFPDPTTVRRRDGHASIQVQDSSTFPTGSPLVPQGWVYGQGQLLNLTNQRSHYPLPLRAGGTFNYLGSDVVWTGDRLLVIRTDGTSATGKSSFWQRDAVVLGVGSDTRAPYGIPAYLPVQTDIPTPESVSGTLVEVALTPSLQVIVATGSNVVTGYVLDRTTGALKDKSIISSTGGSDPTHLRVINSGGTPWVLWLNSSGQLMSSTWNGLQWSQESPLDIATTTITFDVAAIAGGFYVFWRKSDGSITCGQVTGANAVSTNFMFGTVLLTGTGSTGPIAGAVDPAGQLYVVFLNQPLGQLQVRSFLVNGSGTSSATHNIRAQSSCNAGLSCSTRFLKDSVGLYQLVVHSADSSDSVLRFYEMQADPLETGGGNPFAITASNSLPNSSVFSRTFRVGDEVLVWAQAKNAMTNYLIAGVRTAQVCGYADTENAFTRSSDAGGNVLSLSQVSLDPNSATGTAVTWGRRFNVGTYTRAGDALVGSMEFLPSPNFVTFGKSVYSSGSAVRNWDGVNLYDAGFQDFPLVDGSSHMNGAGGSLSAGAYRFRVYAVRYNARGERFISAAVTSAALTAVMSDSATVIIRTTPCANDPAITLEIYRTQANGTAYYLDGTIANSLTANTVTYTSVVSDATLGTNTPDPFATGVGNPQEIQEFGPTGPAFLAVINDRLWGAGGQVSPGSAVFSKLHVTGRGVGFDILAGSIEVNPQGGAVTSLAGFNNAVVAFQQNVIYVTNDTGPDNLGRGGFAPATIVLADGALNHAGTRVLQHGIAYYGNSGPRFLTATFQSQNISHKVSSLFTGVTPVGTRANLALREVVWYTAAGTAYLWNYLEDEPRWSTWTGLPCAGTSDTAHVRPDGYLMTESVTAVGDGDRPFDFTIATNYLRPGELLTGFNVLRRIGVNGKFLGKHQLRFRVTHDGAAMWDEDVLWNPATGTWLTLGSDVSSLTGAQVDALIGTKDHSGGYAVKKRTSRGTNHYFQVEVSDVSAFTPTWQPLELSIELGQEPGLGRVPSSTFTHE